MTTNVWTAADDDVLLRMRRAGKSFEQCSFELQRTVKLCRERANQLGVSTPGAFSDLAVLARCEELLRSGMGSTAVSRLLTEEFGGSPHVGTIRAVRLRLDIPLPEAPAPAAVTRPKTFVEFGGLRIHKTTITPPDGRTVSLAAHVERIQPAQQRSA